jgi:hydroxymethylbilane synthase
VPAVGQGALAVEARAEDEWLAERLHAAVNDPASELCIECERAALRALRAGCSAPLGIHAYLDGTQMVALGAYAPEGGTPVRERLDRSISTLAEARALGIELSALLRSSVATSARGVES